MLQNLDPVHILTALPAILLALSFHEFAHALAGRLLGDLTASQGGRLTINPLKHIDWLGFIFLLLAGFGWAKPVMFNPENLKYKRIGPVIVAMAGPFTNLLLAIICLPFFSLVASIDPYLFREIPNPEFLNIMVLFLKTFFLMNLGLFIFNMLPIPPLDGSWVLFAAIPNLSNERRAQIYRFGSIALFGLLMISSFSKINLLPFGTMIERLANLLLGIVGLS